MTRSHEWVSEWAERVKERSYLSADASLFCRAKSAVSVIISVPSVRHAFFKHEKNHAFLHNSLLRFALLRSACSTRSLARSAHSLTHSWERVPPYERVTQWKCVIRQIRTIVMDRRTDRPSYRDVRSHLITSEYREKSREHWPDEGVIFNWSLQ